MRMIVLVGARPNFIKVGPLMPALEAAGIDAAIAHTGQHYGEKMSDVFFADLSLPLPKWFLSVGSGTHAVQTGRAMIAIEELLDAERPDALIVIGDVNSTLAGALAAAKMGVPIVHLEAGLRSEDMSMPEEINRLVTDQLSAMLLTPTVRAGKNLEREAVDGGRIHFVGNIMAESALRLREAAVVRDVADRYGLEVRRFALATIHRPENVDHPEALDEIAAALGALGVPVLFPCHPRSREAIIERMPEGSLIQLIDPVGYLDMLCLVQQADVVLTDSGGLQEETCVLGTPCVTVRRNTERPETVEAGSNRLAAAARGEIVLAYAQAASSSREWELPDRWDTGVADRVVRALLSGIEPLAC